MIIYLLQTIEFEEHENLFLTSNKTELISYIENHPLNINVNYNIEKFLFINRFGIKLDGNLFIDNKFHNGMINYKQYYKISESDLL